MSNKENNYNLYQDQKREIEEFLHRLRKESRKFVPHWWNIFFIFLKEKLEKIASLFSFVNIAILLAVIVFVYLLFVNLSLKKTPHMEDTEVKTTPSEVVISQRNKPVITDTQFYRDGNLLICETNMYIPPRTFEVVATFVSDSGEPVAVHSQPVVFNENRKVRFVLPYDSKIKKVKINVK